MGKKGKFNPIISILSIIIVILLVLCGFLLYAKGKADRLSETYKAAYEDLLNEKVQSEQTTKNKEKLLAQYEAKMREVVNLMIDGAVVSENCANLMQSVWNNCIFQIKNSATDKYTLDSSGEFYEDFNDALGNLYRDEIFITDNQTISDNQDRVTMMIRELKNPPEEWKDAYSELLVYYESYYDFTELVLHTNCSLTEFKELFAEYDSESAKQYQKMKLYLE